MDTLVADPFWTAFPEFFGEPLPELFKSVQKDAWPRFERGEIDARTWAREAFSDGRRFDLDALTQALHAGYAFIDGIEDLLVDLKSEAVPMHILSNYPVWYERIEKKLALRRYLPWTFVSWHTGVRKPNAEAYLGPLRTLGIEPAQAVFIDDRESNVTAAEALGLHGVIFESVPQLRGALAGLGIPLTQGGGEAA